MVGAALSSCSTDGASVGGGLPQLHAGESVDAAPVAFRGVLRVGADGCQRVRVDEPAGSTADRWAVWPTGGDLAADGYGAAVDGETYVDGDAVTGTGRLVDLAALPNGASPGSYFNGSGRYCHADTSGVLVMDDVAHA